jgi:RNA polymerase sporulation-specific sigma factor
LPTLTHLEAAELLQKIHKNKDSEARSYFILANFRLVLSVVQRYSKRVNNLDDLFQIGCVGLIKAVDNFDCTLNTRFSTYAVPMIIGEIRRYLRESNSLRVSRSIRDVAYQALQTREKLEKEATNEVSVEQISEELQLPVFRVTYCLDAISEPISIYEKVYSNDDDTLSIIDQIADKTQNENYMSERISLSDALKHLSPREKDVILKRYFQDKTQIEVSDEVGISQAQVSRLEKNAVSHLRQNMS